MCLVGFTRGTDYSHKELSLFFVQAREKALAAKRSLWRLQRRRITAAVAAVGYFLSSEGSEQKYCGFCRRKASVFHIIHMRFFAYFQAQRPEQSVMQALESLSDSQVRLRPFFRLLIAHCVHGMDG